MKREIVKVLIANFIDRVRKDIGNKLRIIERLSGEEKSLRNLIIRIEIFEKYLKDFKKEYDKAEDVIKRIEHINKEIGECLEKIERIRNELNKLENMLSMAREKLMKEYDIMEHEIDELKPKFGVKDIVKVLKEEGFIIGDVTENEHEIIISLLDWMGSLIIEKIDLKEITSYEELKEFLKKLLY